MKPNEVKELIEFIKSGDWIVWSCGRSTDYVDEFWEEGSIENLVEKIKDLEEKEK